VAAASTGQAPPGGLARSPPRGPSERLELARLWPRRGRPRPSRRPVFCRLGRGSWRPLYEPGAGVWLAGAPGAGRVGAGGGDRGEVIACRRGRRRWGRRLAVSSGLAPPREGDDAEPCRLVVGLLVWVDLVPPPGHQMHATPGRCHPRHGLEPPATRRGHV